MRSMRLLLASILISGSQSAWAQTVCTTSPCVVQVNKPFDAIADHQVADGDTNGYRLYLNGTLSQTKTVAERTNVQPDGTGTITFTIPGQPKSQIVVFIEAFGDGGAASSNSLTANVQPGRPKPPTGLRFVSGS